MTEACLPGRCRSPQPVRRRPAVRSAWLLLLAGLLLAAPLPSGAQNVEKLARAALAEYDAGRYEAALDLYRQAHRIRPLAGLSFAEARCLEALGRWKEALAAAQRALTERPDRALRKRLQPRLEFYEARVKIGHLVITVDPAGSEILVDGVSRGQAPLDPIELPPGPHRALVRHPGRVDVLRTFEVEGGSVTTLSLSLELAQGTLKVNVEPAGARVSVDRVARGQAPIGAMVLPAGSHAVEVTYPGYKAFTRSLTIDTGQEQILNVVLESTSPAWTRNTAAWVVLGTGLAAAGAGAGLAAYAQSELAAVRDAVADPQSTSASQYDLYSRHRAATPLDTAGWVLVGVGSAAVVTSVILFAVASPDGGGSGGVAVAPVFQPDGASLVLTAGF